jgi:hypothetical protein
MERRIYLDDDSIKTNEMVDVDVLYIPEILHMSCQKNLCLHSTMVSNRSLAMPARQSTGVLAEFRQNRTSA